jgi:hypothetical protein
MRGSGVRDRNLDPAPKGDSLNSSGRRSGRVARAGWPKERGVRGRDGRRACPEIDAYVGRPPAGDGPIIRALMNPRTFRIRREVWARPTQAPRLGDVPRPVRFDLASGTGPSSGSALSPRVAAWAVRSASRRLGLTGHGGQKGSRIRLAASRAAGCLRAIVAHLDARGGHLCPTPPDRQFTIRKARGGTLSRGRKAAIVGQEGRPPE